MKITLSVALSSDNYMDDNTPKRLILSTPSDWAEVYKLRNMHDAIVVGGNTLRRDNPSLSPKGEESDRTPLRVVVSGRGAIEEGLKIFHREGGKVVIFSNIERPELSDLAEVIVAPKIDIPLIISALERLGVESLLVEGGAEILKMFLASGEVNTLRVARNPKIYVGDPTAPYFDPTEWITNHRAIEENLDGMEISTYTLSTRGEANSRDKELIVRAITNSLNSPERDSCYRVGAVIETADGAIYDGYTLETSPTHHAEQAAITKALASGAELKGATIYSTIEPCSQRSSEPKSCSELIVEHQFARAVFALYEPSHFVECHGAERLRHSGVEVIYIGGDYARRVVEINSHVLNE
ncbi:MAG: dihydrofolate reductase family protein [Rikenellaceae bacterium]